MTVSIRKPDDMHLHLREGKQLAAYAADSASWFARGLVMPNLSKPVVTADDLEKYRKEIIKAAPGFIPLMTFKITETSRPEDIAPLKTQVLLQVNTIQKVQQRIQKTAERM